MSLFRLIHYLYCEADRLIDAKQKCKLMYYKTCIWIYDHINLRHP